LTQIGGNGQAGSSLSSGAVTLTGGGTVTLDTISTNGNAAYLVGNGETLTNTNNTIQGTGVIGNGSVALINGGVIDATPEGGTSTLTINTSGAFSSTGTLEATGGATLALDIGATTVSGLVSVAASSALDLTGELTVNGTLSNFGAVSGGGATEVAFGSGTDRLILGPGATFGGNVVGGGVHTTLELAAGTGAGTLNALGTTFTNFGTVIVDTGATWTVDAATSLLATTTFIGDGASSTLVLTGAGTFSLGQCQQLRHDRSAGRQQHGDGDRQDAVRRVGHDQRRRERQQHRQRGERHVGQQGQVADLCRGTGRTASPAGSRTTRSMSRPPRWAATR
jgi:hypothetical protein